MISIVKVVCAADGNQTPHDGRYVVAWNPHTIAGDCSITTTDDIAAARRFEGGAAFREWRTVSRVQKIRPWDSALNRPLTALTVEVVKAP